MHSGGNDAKLKIRLSKSSPFEVKMLVEFIRRGISFQECSQVIGGIILADEIKSIVKRFVYEP
jgi:hypothetical protein